MTFTQLPIIKPLIALLHSRTVLIAVAVVLSYLLTSAQPQFAAQQPTIAGLLFGVFMVLAGKITLENIATALVPIFTKPKDAIETAVIDEAHQVLPAQIADLITPQLLDALLAELQRRGQNIGQVG